MEMARDVAKQLSMEGFLTPLRLPPRSSRRARQAWKEVDDPDIIFKVFEKFFVPTLGVESLVS